MSTAKGDRLKYLHDSRRQLYELPCDKLFELPGRPNVIYVIKNYSHDKVKGAAEARGECGFLFKAFETGQIGPRRLARMLGENAPRNATIHEYLDWTVTAVEAKDETEYDFSGFRLILLYPRERNIWPAPNGSKPQPRADARLGAPRDPWPGLQAKGRALTAATIRAGPGYLEVPFVATHETKRGRGFGRCVVEAIEEVARALGIGRLLLCSTCEEGVRNTWKHLGFVETSDADLEAIDVGDPDLIHMQNTIQMHKHVPAARRWRPIRIKHEAFVARTYAPIPQPGSPGAGRRREEEAFAVGMTNSRLANGAASSLQTGGGGSGPAASGRGGDGAAGGEGEGEAGSRPRKRGPGGGDESARPRKQQAAEAAAAAAEGGAEPIGQRQQQEQEQGQQQQQQEEEEKEEQEQGQGQGQEREEEEQQQRGPEQQPADGQQEQAEERDPAPPRPGSEPPSNSGRQQQQQQQQPALPGSDRSPEPQLPQPGPPPPQQPQRQPLLFGAGTGTGGGGGVDGAAAQAHASEVMQEV